GVLPAAVPAIRRAVAVDSMGDAVAVGFTYSSGTGRDVVIVKVSGTTGATRWMRLLSGHRFAGNGVASNDDGRAVAIDDAGDVVAAGTLQNCEPSSLCLPATTALTVAKFRGTAGGIACGGGACGPCEGCVAGECSPLPMMGCYESIFINPTARPLLAIRDPAAPGAKSFNFRWLQGDWTA